MLVRVRGRDIQVPKKSVESLLGVYLDLPYEKGRQAFLDRTYHAADTVSVWEVTDESRRRLKGEDIPRFRRGPRRAQYVRVLRALISRYGTATKAANAIRVGQSKVLPDLPRDAHKDVQLTLDLRGANHG